MLTTPDRQYAEHRPHTVQCRPGQVDIQAPQSDCMTSTQPVGSTIVHSLPLCSSLGMAERTTPACMEYSQIDNICASWNDSQFLHASALLCAPISCSGEAGCSRAVGTCFQMKVTRQRCADECISTDVCVGDAAAACVQQPLLQTQC
jgi:hypothetical protein